MNSRWMDVRSVGCFVIFLDSGDVARSWNFHESCLFLVDWGVSAQRFVRLLVAIACFELPFLSRPRMLLEWEG